MSSKNIFLFSIDLEDVRNMIPNGWQYEERVPEMVKHYVAFLKKHDARCTFFTVGDQLRAYPDMIRSLVDHGHEIACHTNTHTQLTKLTPEAFRKDVDQFLHSAIMLGLPDIRGFRAPTFSLTAKSRWAYSVLKEYGFEYSSSVLPAKNPLYGWEEFGTAFRTIDGIFEMPVTLHPLLTVPLAGGVYFRTIPFWMLKGEIRKLFSLGIPLQNYLHPYDIDIHQEHFMHPDLNGSKLLNRLMYYDRKNVFNKLEKIMDMGCRIMRYDEYIFSSKIRMN